MIGAPGFTADQGDGSLLYVAELLHRVHNEYTKTISFASSVALRSSNPETASALSKIVDRLHASATVNRVLLPPVAGATVDFTANLTKMCKTIASSDFNERAIALHLVIPEPIFLDGVRAWRASLILSELITNASRHAFGPKGGKISAAISVNQGFVVCQVSDDGKSASTPRAGLGTQLIDAIAADLDGNVERCFTKEGAAVTLRFPKEGRRSQPQSVSFEGAEHHNDICNAPLMR